MNIFRKLRVRLWKLSMQGLPRAQHITRYAMYKRFKTIGNGLPNRCGRALTISYSKHLCRKLTLQPIEIVEANYPEQNILSLDYPDCSFDFVLSDQVIEHVEGDPQQAIDECWRILRPGGIAVHTTCLINPIHGAPHDFWRFTPDGLRLLSRKFSEVIDCDGWGNFMALQLIRDGLRKERVPYATWHPFHRIALRNDPLWPIVTWIVARK